MAGGVLGGGVIAMVAVPAIAFHNLTLGYDRQPVVLGLDAVLDRGSLTAVVGPNGAGKSTLLKGIVGALRPLAGRIEIAHDARRSIAYLPQLAEIDRSFPVTVADVVAMGLWRQVGAFGTIGRDAEDSIAEALAAVGLAGFGWRSIGALSSGQMQRVLFARLLLQDAPIILLDEPFTAIDTKTAADLLAIVRRWQGEERTVVVVLHDIDLVRDSFPRAILLARELVASGPAAEVLTAANLAEARRLSEIAA